jgi:hypothetical protein
VGRGLSRDIQEAQTQGRQPLKSYRVPPAGHRRDDFQETAIRVAIEQCAVPVFVQFINRRKVKRKRGLVA